MKPSPNRRPQPLQFSGTNPGTPVCRLKLETTMGNPILRTPGSTSLYCVNMSLMRGDASTKSLFCKNSRHLKRKGASHTNSGQLRSPVNEPTETKCGAAGSMSCSHSVQSRSKLCFSKELFMKLTSRMNKGVRYQRARTNTTGDRKVSLWKRQEDCSRSETLSSPIDFYAMHEANKKIAGIRAEYTNLLNQIQLFRGIRDDIAVNMGIALSF